jgi:hypothetical protein
MYPAMPPEELGLFIIGSGLFHQERGRHSSEERVPSLLSHLSALAIYLGTLCHLSAQDKDCRDRLLNYQGS